MQRIKKYFKKRRKVCFFTENKFTKIDFKDIELLSKFMTNRGKILPSIITGTSVKWQKRLAKAIKISRHMAIKKQNEKNI
ncbi:30S ribosomal protein S18 [Candidatus Phytoplasma sp. AldY-WA1]|jgi:small subunit ribosomal protein S18|uniref:30S ribosomal protein S18 n=1 Tax=Candidatus Phytoplasma sp. AldY-WA1 TaxID=2852100 RepID=UPI001CE2FF11|nr:30S ribosomal protein S18 [Candidatus Phytoplasma sp. AldY-WA1]USQ93402.1 MAG: 30S ribosomal protein S18 [Candidatus Phytoplasma vitis]